MMIIGFSIAIIMNYRNHSDVDNLKLFSYQAKNEKSIFILL